MSKAASSKVLVKNTLRSWDGLTPYSPQAIDHAKKIFAHEGRFVWSAARIDSLPAAKLPEIAFLGCSNVGKSTLLNILLGRKRHKLVRTSSKPGHTTALNGFQVGRDLCLVDSPGYGYRSRDEWGPLIMKYLRSRTSLKRTCLLIESSHGYKSHDEELIKDLAVKGVPFQIVLTKIDKLGGNEVTKLLEHSESYLRKVGKAAVWGEVVGVSSDSERHGIAALRASLCGAAGLFPANLGRLPMPEEQVQKETTRGESSASS